MKTVIAILAAAMISAHADPLRYPVRIFGDGWTVNLQPLFNWWTNSENLKIRKVDITNLNTNQIASVTSNVWSKLPRKPLPGWCRIQATNIVQGENYWLVDAEVQLSPQISRHEKIYVKHPPIPELKLFNSCRAAIDALNEQGGVLSHQEDASQDRLADAHRNDDNVYQIERVFPNSAAANAALNKSENSVTAAERNDNVIFAKQEEITREIKAYSYSLEQLPPGYIYQIDHFAVRIGQTADGIEIYDLGQISFQ